MPHVTVSDRPAADRYVLEVDGAEAGFLTYRRVGDQLVMIHAEIHPAHGKQGYGSRLAHDALDDVRARGLTVLPLCPFVSDYIRRNPEYADLIPAGLRSRFGLAA